MRARSKTAKKWKQPQLQPKQAHEQRQVSNPKAFGLHRQRKKNCAARASMHVPVEASKRAYNLHRKQKRTKKTCAAVGDRSQLLLNERRKAWRPVPSKSGTDASKNKPNTSRRLQKSCRLLVVFCRRAFCVQDFFAVPTYMFSYFAWLFLVFLRPAFF